MKLSIAIEGTISTIDRLEWVDIWTIKGVGTTAVGWCYG